jgi:threonine/homoserine efflux transporter RhtA
MTAITDIALRHRKLVALVWIALAVAGVLTLSSTTGSLTHSLATPGTPA